MTGIKSSSNLRNTNWNRDSLHSRVSVCGAGGAITIPTDLFYWLIMVLSHRGAQRYSIDVHGTRFLNREDWFRWPLLCTIRTSGTQSDEGDGRFPCRMSGRVPRADGEHPPASLHGAHELPRGTKQPCYVKHVLLPLSPAAETGPRLPPVTRLEEGRRIRASRWVVASTFTTSLSSSVLQGVKHCGKNGLIRSFHR